MSVVARYESRCTDCGGMIRVGDPIVSEGIEDEQLWRHETCPPGRLDIVRPVCDECFTEKSVGGACMCGAS